MQVNHVQKQVIVVPSITRAEEGVAGKEASAARAPLGRTQSARPAVVSEPATEPMPAKSLTSEAAVGLEDSAASEASQPRPRVNSANPISLPITMNAATSSPSRESRERAEEVARKVVSATSVLKKK